MTADAVRIARVVCHHMTDIADADLVVEMLHHRANPSEPQEGVGKGDTRRVVYLIHARRNEMIRMREEAVLGIEHVEVAGPDLEADALPLGTGKHKVRTAGNIDRGRCADRI